MRSVLFILLFIPVAAFSQFRGTQPNSLEVEADTLMNRQDFAGAIKLYTKLIESTQLKERVDYRALYKRSVAYYSNSNFKEALADINKFIPQFETSYQAHILRALCYRELEDVDNQLVDLETAISLSGGDPQLLKWRAGLLIEKEKFNEAIKDLLQIRELQDDAEAELNLGYAYYSVQKLDSAILALNRAIELEPTFLPPFLYGGSFSLEQANYELALKYLNVALMLDSENSTAWFYKGVALIELKKEDEACSCLRKAFYAGNDDAGDYLKQYCYGVED